MSQRSGVAAEVTNFGGNIRFVPQACQAAANEAELLEILGRHRGEKIRVAGRLHSWSPLIPVEGVLLDLRKHAFANDWLTELFQLRDDINQPPP